MQFVPRIKTSREPYQVPAKCSKIIEKLKFEKKQLVICQYTDPSKVLHLLSTFANRSAAGIEKQLNKYFMKELSARCAFITTFLNQEAQIRAIGPNKLKYYYRIILGYRVVDELYQRCISAENQSLGHLHPDVRQCFEEILEGDEGEMISVPILVPKGSAVKFLLLSLLDTKRDLMLIVKFVYETFGYCLTSLLNAVNYDLVRRDRLRIELLVAMLKRIYLVFDDIDQVMRIVLAYAVDITNSTEGTLYLLDRGFDDMMSMAYSTLSEKIDRTNLLHNLGIAGRTARTGKSIVIKRVHPELLEQLPGVKVKCMFSFAIVYQETLLCVIQLYNKRGGDYMIQDCEIATMFNKYCGEIIAKCANYQKLHIMERQSQMSNSLLTYHVKFLDASIEQMLHCAHDYLDFGTFEFDPRSMLLADTSTWAMRIFENMKLLQKFKINREKFAKFILHIRFACHDFPYHNWLHTFTTLYFAYVVITSTKLIERKIINELEALAVMIICLAHRLDFRGHIYAFKLQLGAQLSNMYISCGHITQIHYFNQLVHILGLNECNILENMDIAMYTHFLQLVNKYMMITDMSLHESKAQYITSETTFAYTSVFKMDTISLRIKSVLMSAIVITSILSDFIRDFKTSLYAFQLIHEEIHQSKDFTFLPHNDLPENVKLYRIPQLHRSFLKKLVRPSLFILTDLLPDLADFLDSLRQVRLCWKYSEKVVDSYDAVFIDHENPSIELLHRPSFTDKIMSAIQASTDVIISEVDEMSIYPEVEEEIAEEEDSDDEACNLATAQADDSESLFNVGLGYDVIGTFNY